jgi:hypothetical protein
MIRLLLPGCLTLRWAFATASSIGTWQHFLKPTGSQIPLDWSVHVPTVPRLSGPHSHGQSRLSRTFLKAISRDSCNLFKCQLLIVLRPAKYCFHSWLAADLIVDRRRVYTFQQTSLLSDASFDPPPNLMLKFGPITSYGSIFQSWSPYNLWMLLSWFDWTLYFDLVVYSV